jgi:hypothetical protein
MNIRVVWRRCGYFDGTVERQVLVGNDGVLKGFVYAA